MRDKVVSMAKGTAIILMVIGHSNFSKYGFSFIYLFHMPLFFFLSGYCFKDSYLEDFKTFSIKRIKGAYFPYVKWGLIFLLLHNIFYNLHIYDSTYGDSIYGIKDFLTQFIYYVLSMTHAEKLLGGYWFLHSYFIASFLLFFILLCCKGKQLRMLYGGGILLIVSMLMGFYKIKIPGYIVVTEVLATFFMLAGYLYKKSGLKLEQYPLLILPVSLISLVIGVVFWPTDMINVKYNEVIPYCITAMTGTLMILSLCYVLKRINIVDKLLSYIGDRTIDILTWHFLSFKIVTLFIIGIYGLSIQHLAEFPVLLDYSRNGWWLLYVIIGVSVPLLIKILLSRFYTFWGNMKCLKKN